MDEIFGQIEEYIKNNDLARSFQLFRNCKLDNTRKNELLLLESRFNELRNNRNSDTLKDEEYSRRLTKLTRDILEFKVDIEYEFALNTESQFDNRFPITLGRIGSHRHHCFGGRDSDINIVIRRLRQDSSFLVIRGESGVGKSSFLDGGIIGRLILTPNIKPVQPNI